MFAPSKTMWRDHGNKFPQRPSSAQPRLSRPRPPVVVVKGLPQKVARSEAGGSQGGAKASP